MIYRRFVGLFSLILFTSGASIHAADTLFQPRELFRIPFGSNKEALGVQMTDKEMKIPSRFTIDNFGHFYIYDDYKHRIARFSPSGVFEIGYTYAASLKQIFARPDDRQNLWLLMADPRRGFFYGIYDRKGQEIRVSTLSQYDHLRLHVGDDGELRAILSLSSRPGSDVLYDFDQDKLILKKSVSALPPEDHHAVKKGDSTYYVNAVPGTSRLSTAQVHRITNTQDKRTSEIAGNVIYITGQGEVYTQVGERELRVYGVDGSLKGKFLLPGLASSLNSLRFDEKGTIYQLDGIPNAEHSYASDMPGMRLIAWER